MTQCYNNKILKKTKIYNIIVDLYCAEVVGNSFMCLKKNDFV